MSQMNKNFLSLAFLLCLGVALVQASSHSEAPGTAANPSSDISDVYFFTAYESGKSDSVVFIADIYPGQKPFAGPNYYTVSDSHMFEAVFSCNNGDALADHTFQFYFGAQLGGPTGTLDNYFDETNQCALDDIFDLTNTGTGVALTIGPAGNQRTNPVPLKVLQPLSAANPAGANGLQNWFEYYRIKYRPRSGDATVLTRPTGGASNPVFNKPFDYVGEKTFGSAADYENYARQYIYNIDNAPTCPSGARPRVFVGSRADPFHVNLGRIFDLINFVPIPGFPNAIKNCESNDVIGDSNIVALVLEIPKSCLPCNNRPVGAPNVLAAYARVGTLEHDGEDGSGDDHVFGEQTNRLGMPLVNEVVIGLPDKKYFNTNIPDNDGVTIGGKFVDYVTHPTFPTIVSLLFLDAVNAQLDTTLSTLAPSNYPRLDLVAAFLTGIPNINQPTNVKASEMIRLNLDTEPTPAADQSPFGVLGGDSAGFPNGRRPGDDALDIVLRVAMGALCYIPDNPWCTAADAPVGNVAFLDGAPVSAADFDDFFPYLTTPNPGSVTDNRAGTCSPAATLVLSFASLFSFLFAFFFFA